MLVSPRYSSLEQVHSAFELGKETCASLVEYYLQKINETASLNAYIEVFADEARLRAKALDEKYKATPALVGRLFGMVVSLKDVICYEGHKVTAASKILEGFESLFSATAVERLLAEDAIIIGRVNCDQFAMGSTNENSVYGPTRNGLNSEKVPGGSSGASAVSVQVDTCLASLGSDTGGSVRQPAAFCGVVGLKPTYGRISRYGLLAYGSSFDQIGTLTHSIQDAGLLLEIMAGSDGFDGTASSSPVGKYSEKTESKTYKMAYFDTAIQHEGMDAEIQKQTLDYFLKLRDKGHQVESVTFDLLDFMIPAYYVLTTAEASSNLSRYDGVRYGYRHSAAKSLEDVYALSRTEGFSMEVKKRIMLGAFVLSAGYYDAYYSKAQQIRRLLSDRTKEILAEYDFIILPVSPTSVGNIGEASTDAVAMYLADIYTVYANMVGMPAIAFPIGVHQKDKMPIGIQLMANKFEEQKLLACAGQLYH